MKRSLKFNIRQKLLIGFALLLAALVGVGGYAILQLNELEQTIKLPPIVTGIRAMTRWLGLMSKRGLIETEAHESAATAIIGAVSTRTISRHLAKLQASTRSQREHQQELAEMFARALGAKTPQPPKKEPRRRPAKARPRTRTAQS